MNGLLRALPLVVLLGLAVWRPTPGEALIGTGPAIRSIVPAEAAPGQLVAIQGTSLFDPAHPEVTEVRFTQAGKVALAQAVAGPSAGDVVYVRVPAGLSGTQQVTIRTLDDGKVSAPMGLRVRAKPGTPVPVRLVDISQAGFPPLTSVRRGQTVGVQAFGTASLVGSSWTASFRTGLSSSVSAPSRAPTPTLSSASSATSSSARTWWRGRAPCSRCGCASTGWTAT